MRTRIIIIIVVVKQGRTWSLGIEHCLVRSFYAQSCPILRLGPLGSDSLHESFTRGGGGRSIGGDRNALLTSAKQSRSLLVQQQRGFAHDLGAGSNQEQQLVFVRDCEGCPCPHQRVKHVRPFQIQPPLEGDLPLPRPAECHVRGTPQRKFQDGFHLGHSSINRSIHFILLDF